MESTGNDYGVGKSAVCETIQQVENTLIKDKTFRLPDKKILKRGASSVEYIKASKKHKLTKTEKAFNMRLARKRIVIEHINAKIKTFKSMSYPYRNHCKRHLLRITIICAIINFELRI